MNYADIPLGDLIRKRRELTDEIRALWSQHAKLKRERDAVDAAIAKHQCDMASQPKESEAMAS